jgi:hypothetical protein
MSGAGCGEHFGGGPVGLPGSEARILRGISKNRKMVPPRGGSSRTGSEGPQTSAGDAGLVLVFQKSAMPRIPCGTVESRTTTDLPSPSRPVTTHR